MIRSIFEIEIYCAVVISLSRFLSIIKMNYKGISFAAHKYHLNIIGRKSITMYINCRCMVIHL